MDKILNRAADNIRILAASMVEKAKSGHPGGAMGGADFVNVLYSQFLNFDPDDMTWANRDRFFLDPGHMSPMLYSVLSLVGCYSMEDLKNFRQWGSVTPGHPEVDQKRGVENTSGPLGQGHAMAVGAAIAERFLVARFGEWMSHKTYAFISDGGIQEEISQGAGRIAGTLGLSNLIMFYDANDVQLSTRVNEVTCEDTALKYQAWGWNVITINGNDASAIINALKAANEEKERPTLIIGRTLMGKGAMGPNGEDFSNKVSTHGQPLTGAGASIEKTIENLGGDPQNPFVIFPEVQEFYAKVLNEKRAYAKAKKAEQAAWEKANPELAAKWHKFFSGKAPEIDYKAIQHKANIATRAASADVLAALAQQVENMIVSSADLSNSDKTDGFLKGGARNLVKGDFSGAFLQAGVAELTMAVICNGIALHGGVFAACGTFFVFSDYMKNAMRMSAIMKLPVMYILTHDSIGVGEDGPTHQPIEQLSALRTMPNMRVFRPADLRETAAAYVSALTAKCPTSIVLSRQNLVQLENSGKDALKGGYIAEDCAGTPDVIIIATGSEVGVSLEAKALLEKEGIKVRVVSMPCCELFDEQSDSYREAVLPGKVRARVAVEAGCTATWYKYVGLDGKVVGIDTFGTSAPASVLMKYYGFTADNIAETAKSVLKK